MFATDANFQVGARVASLFDTDLHQCSDARLIDALERILREDLVLEVIGEECADVVTRETKCCLREIVRAEGEEIRVFRNFIRGQRRAGQLDHRADEILDLHLLLCHHLVRDAADNGFLIGKLVGVPNKRHHDFRQDFHLLLLAFHGGLDDRPGLHFRNFREGDSQAAATVAQHGVQFVEGANAAFEFARGDPEILGQLRDGGGLVGHKLVQWRIEKADGDGKPLHRLENFHEVLPLIRQKLHDRFAPFFRRLGNDHFADGADSLGIEEHVLGAAKADAFRSETAGAFRVRTRVRIGAYADGPVFFSNLHQLLVEAVLVGVGQVELESPFIDMASGAIQRD